MYETTGWRVRCRTPRAHWTETYYAATEEAVRELVEYTYPGVVIESIEPAPKVFRWQTGRTGR
jgi:hypothetical protein